MMKLFRLNLLFAFMLAISFASCTKDDKKIDTEDPFTSDYSEKTAEEAKKDVEDAGVALVNEIDLLENSEAIDVMMEMMNRMGGSDEQSAIASSKFNIPLQSAFILSDESKSTTEVYSLLKAATEEGLALSDSFAAQTATYVYNSVTGEFDKEDNADAIVFKFPGKEGDQTNTAEVWIGDFTVMEITEPRGDFDLPAGTIEFPTGLNAKLKYDGTEIMSYNLAASFMSDGTPTSLVNTLTIGEFSFVQKLTHSQYQNASFAYSFNRAEKVLIGFGAEVKGDWSEDNIDANTYEVNDSYETWTETDVEEIINSGNAYITIMDLKAVGEVNIKALADGEQAFDAAHEGDKDQYGNYPEAIREQETDNLVALAKEHAKFVLVYGTDNTLIAAMEPYKVIETDSYTDWDQQVHTYTDYNMDFRMIFKDDSPVAMKTFVQDELSGFFDALNNFIAKINTDYDTNIDPVDPNDVVNTDEEDGPDPIN